MKSLNNDNNILFEISWEVCNKVGGINTVISTKSEEANRYYRNRYYLIGPDHKSNDFKEIKENQEWYHILGELRSKGIHARYGYWDIPSKPITILINCHKAKFGDTMLYEQLLKENIDIKKDKWEGVKCSIFGLLAGYTINIISKLFMKNKKIVAHFHEWMCGTGVIFLKNNNSRVSTVFTTHATSIGRYLSKLNVEIYKDLKNIDPDYEAKRLNIETKHLIEKLSAQRCDIFTVVSKTLALESKYFLKRIPDFITCNGININNFYLIDRKIRLDKKAEIINNINCKLGWSLSANTKILFFSGRAEFTNKGLDIALSALKSIESQLQQNKYDVLFICAILMQPNHIIYFTPPSVQFERTTQSEDKTNGYFNITKEFLFEFFKSNHFENKPYLKYLFIPSFLDGNDGIINIDYNAFLPICDLGIYPSFYEPWGYTAHETALSGVPTITSDISGFGQWVIEQSDKTNGIFILNRKNMTKSNVINELGQKIISVINMDDFSTEELRNKANKIALECSWQNIYKEHVRCYNSLFETIS